MPTATEGVQPLPLKGGEGLPPSIVTPSNPSPEAGRVGDGFNAVVVTVTYGYRIDLNAARLGRLPGQRSSVRLDHRLEHPLRRPARRLLPLSTPYAETSLREIAHRYGVAEQTVNKHVRRARERLAEEYGLQGLELASIIHESLTCVPSPDARIPCPNCLTPALPCDCCIEHLMRQRGW